MPDYEHKKIIETITWLDAPPSDAQAFAEWINANAHLAFLRDNAEADELVFYASGEYTFIHSLIVPNERLSPPDQDDLLCWNCNAHASIASYVSGGEQERVWLERGITSTGTKALQGAVQLVFARGFEGWSGPGRNYLELHQEYAHVTGIHWRPEKRAYCRFNGDGDLESIVSVTYRDDKGSTISLATFKWGRWRNTLSLPIRHWCGCSISPSSSEKPDS